MRQRTILAIRALIVLLLAAAIFDVPLPARSRDRVRVHLVDRSGSVLVPGPPESLTPADADRAVAWDRSRAAPGDAVLSVSFAADVSFESVVVDPSSTDLAGAIEAVLARNPTEIVLYTDGRADQGRALLFCRARGVPVHVFPLGPVSVRDARLRKVSAPASAAPGETAPIDLTVEATFTGPLRVRVGDETRDIDVTAGVPAILPFARPAGPFRAAIETQDACPQNNQVEGEILVRSQKRRVLVLSDGRHSLSDFDVKATPKFENPQGYDAVVLDNVALAPQQQRALASYVRDFGGGLLLLGGPRSYAPGGWQGTPIEEVSPLLARPDQRVAVVFGIDSSGSMAAPGKFDTVVGIVLRARKFFAEGDDAAAMTFAEEAEFVPWERLTRVTPTGGTHVAKGIEAARRHLEQATAGRKHLVLLTDGETAPAEEPKMRKDAAALLHGQGIGLTVVTTNKELEVGDPVKIGDWNALFSTLRDLVLGLQDVERKDPGPLDLREHPATAGVSPVDLPWINRTSPKRDAQVAATVGRAPDVSPVVAFRQAGRGRVGAFAFGFEVPLPRLFRQSLEFVAGASEDGPTLSIDPPIVRARGSGPPSLEAAWQAVPSGESGTTRLDQVRSDLWEGTLPPTRPGTVFVSLGRSRAAAVIPCAAEVEALGVDRAALERIASETGGRVLRLWGDLEAIPRPARTERRSGRTVFLASALALFFLEMALSTFWKG